MLHRDPFFIPAPLFPRNEWGVHHVDATEETGDEHEMDNDAV